MKRYFAPSASVQEAAMATQGPSRCEGRRPVIRKSPAAMKPQSAPAVPATVKARITVVMGGHLWRKIALKSALSRSLILRARFFNLGSPGIVPVFGPSVRERVSKVE